MKAPELIVALDVENESAAKAVITQLQDHIHFYKVGLRLFVQAGPTFIQWLKSKKLKVFLDLKFHDIPNTVAQAVESAVTLGIDLLTIHASGGIEMLQAAVQAAQNASQKLKIPAPELFAVTVLTSTHEITSLGITDSIANQVIRLATLAHQAQCTGIVCSPQEVKFLRKLFPPSFKILTPGIRLEDGIPHDQKRIATPKQAIQDGSNYLVIGRPILNSQSPVQTILKILDEMKA